MSSQEPPWLTVFLHTQGSKTYIYTWIRSSVKVEVETNGGGHVFGGQNTKGSYVPLRS